MSTSNGPILADEATAPSRGPLRLRMADHPGRDHLDGGWWPQSRDLTVELPDLVENFPPGLGRIVRVLYSPPDWETAPRRIPVAGGYVKVGSFPQDDTHLVDLTTSDRTVLRILVVPPGFSDSQGDEALLAAATSGNAHSGAAVLETVTEHPDVDPEHQWSDGGGSFWGSEPVAPSFRPGT